jgi:glycosyltransferase involved in cell wall biosynthesis
MAQMGHEVGLIYGEGHGRAVRQVVAGVTCIDAAPLWQRPFSLLEFLLAMRTMSPDLLYARIPGDFLWMLGTYARCRQGARFVYAIAHDVHCDPWKVYFNHDPYRWFHRSAYALGLKSAHVIAVQHENQAQLMSPHLRKRLAQIPNLVRSFHEQPRAYGLTRYDAIWIANIRPDKQLHHFLDLAEWLPNLSFAVVGGFGSHLEAEQRHALDARMKSLKNVLFWGAQNASEVHALLSQSRVLVNTSSAEGFPNTILEAWSVGVPVVSLSVDPGGVITQNRLGLVSGTADALRRDVHMVAQTEALNEELGSRGLSYVRQRHSLEAVCEALTQALAPRS